MTANLKKLKSERTNYHYAPPSDEIEVNQKSMKMFTELLDELHVKYTVGKTWTTDSFYRETPEKVKRRKAAGCICVDMECSANAAVCDFRGKNSCSFSTLPTIWMRKSGIPGALPTIPAWKTRTGLLRLRWKQR